MSVVQFKLKCCHRRIGSSPRSRPIGELISHRGGFGNIWVCRAIASDPVIVVRWNCGAVIRYSNTDHPPVHYCCRGNRNIGTRHKSKSNGSTASMRFNRALVEPLSKFKDSGFPYINKYIYIYIYGILLLCTDLSSVLDDKNNTYLHGIVNFLHVGNECLIQSKWRGQNYAQKNKAARPK